MSWDDDKDVDVECEDGFHLGPGNAHCGKESWFVVDRPPHDPEGEGYYCRKHVGFHVEEGSTVIWSPPEERGK